MASAFWWGWGMPSGTQRGWAQLPLRLKEKPQALLTVVRASVQSKSPLAVVTLLLGGPKGWCASMAVAVDVSGTPGTVLQHSTPFLQMK